MPDGHDEFLSDASTDASTEFSLDKFYTSAVNKKGFHRTVRLGVPPSLLTEIGRIVAAKIVPQYTTTNDAIRDFVFVGMMFRLEQISDPAFVSTAYDWKEVIEVQEFLDRLAKEQEMVEVFEAAFRVAQTDEQQADLKRRALAAADRMESVDAAEKMRRLH